jgi:hypothetical protein
VVNTELKTSADFESGTYGYFIAVAMLLKRHFNALVMNGIAVNKQMAMAAAINPYSIAVAPDSSFTKVFMFYPRSLLQPDLNPGFDELLVILCF